ncbi:hypothetical protein PG990_006903 [Apiospora arundinis]|uniref:Uncharacterized protein n=1 Tax=Apiospora arundinis TaxID=335852 RepID=A0ABR2JBR3_9PEZI
MAPKTSVILLLHGHAVSLTFTLRWKGLSLSIGKCNGDVRQGNSVSDLATCDWAIVMATHAVT